MGQQKESWFRDEEEKRKKLEKAALYQMKCRIAQQNRQAGNKNSQVPPEPDNDSDMEPPDRNEDNDLGSNAVIAN